MTATCPSCNRPEHDGLLCTACTRALRLDLEHLPENWSILQEVITRQTKRGDGSGESALPFNPAASAVGWEVNNTITTWVRELDAGDTPGLRPTIRSMVGWLLGRMQRIRGHKAAGELVDELRYACRSVRIAIDLPPELRLVGDCPLCGSTLMAPLAAQEVTCRRCAVLGVESVHPVPEMRQRLAERVEDELVSRALALQVVAKVWGIEVNQGTFRVWIHRGRLTAADVSISGVPLYRVGDVLDLAQGERVTA